MAHSVVPSFHTAERVKNACLELTTPLCCVLVVMAWYGAGGGGEGREPSILGGSGCMDIHTIDQLSVDISHLEDENAGHVTML